MAARGKALETQQKPQFYDLKSWEGTSSPPVVPSEPEKEAGFPAGFAHLASIKSWQDVIQFAPDIAKCVKENPEFDAILYFEPQPIPWYKTLEINNVPNPAGLPVLAGGAALQTVCRTFGKEIGDARAKLNLPARPKQSFFKWEATDADLFFLNMPGNERRALGKLDVVYNTEKTVAELLLNFELPVCRIATEIYTATNVHICAPWHISLQCIFAILTGTYPFPKYCLNEQQFKDILSCYRDGPGLSDQQVQGQDFQAKRLAERIVKYHQRGFTATGYTTRTILPWIIKRFRYAEWSTNLRHNAEMARWGEGVSPPAAVKEEEKQKKGEEEEKKDGEKQKTTKTKAEILATFTELFAKQTQALHDLQEQMRSLMGKTISDTSGEEDETEVSKKV